MTSNLKLAIKTALFGGAMLTATSAFSADKELLNTLLSNGSINSTQHAKLLSSSAASADNDLLDTLLSNGSINSTQHAKLTANASTSDNASFITKEDLKAFDWVKKIKIKGDMRYRYETQWDQKQKSRHRIRARIAISAKPTDDLKVSMRLATGGSATSTNATLDDGFNQKSFWLDRAYFDYSPVWAQGVHFIGGKMKQQWYQVSNNVWDSDVNPDGLALKYSIKAGPAKITALGGYYLINKQVDGEVSWSSNSYGLSMGHYGIDTAFKFGKNVKLSVGHNGYIYANTGKYDLGGNNSMGVGFEIFELASKLKIKTGLMPITLVAQYSGNAAVNKDGNAWLLGARTKFKGVKFGYDYRSTERDAVVDMFNDSDFNGGKTNAQGHRVKLSYGLNKYFSVGATYFNAVTMDSNKKPLQMMQMDIKAKF